MYRVFLKILSRGGVESVCVFVIHRGVRLNNGIAPCMRKYNSIMPRARAPHQRFHTCDSTHGSTENVDWSHATPASCSSTLTNASADTDAVLKPRTK